MNSFVIFIGGILLWLLVQCHLFLIAVTITVVFFILKKKYREAIIFPILYIFLFISFFSFLFATNARTKILCIIPEINQERIFTNETINNFYHEAMRCLETRDTSREWVRSYAAPHSYIVPTIIKHLQLYSLNFIVDKQALGSIECYKKESQVDKTIPLTMNLNKNIVIWGNAKKLNELIYPKKILYLFSSITFLFILFSYFLIRPTNISIIQDSHILPIGLGLVPVFFSIFVAYSYPGFFYHSKKTIHEITQEYLTSHNKDSFKIFHGDGYDRISINPYCYLYFTKSKYTIPLTSESHLSPVRDNVYLVRYEKYINHSNRTTVAMWGLLTLQLLCIIWIATKLLLKKNTA